MFTDSAVTPRRSWYPMSEFRSSVSAVAFAFPTQAVFKPNKEDIDADEETVPHDQCSCVAQHAVHTTHGLLYLDRESTRLTWVPCLLERKLWTGRRTPRDAPPAARLSEVIHVCCRRFPHSVVTKNAEPYMGNPEDIQVLRTMQVEIANRGTQQTEEGTTCFLF